MPHSLGRSACRQGVVLAVPAAEAAVLTLVGDDPHVSEEPVLPDELVAVIRGDDGQHPSIGLEVVLTVLVTALERLADDNRFRREVAVAVLVVATDGQPGREVVHVDGLWVQRAA